MSVFLSISVLIGYIFQIQMCSQIAQVFVFYSLFDLINLKLNPTIKLSKESADIKLYRLSFFDLNNLIIELSASFK